MARESVYQSIGNPLQPDRLPPHRPELRFPFRGTTPAQDGRVARRALFYFCLLAAGSMISELLQIGARFSAQPMSLLVINTLLVAAGVSLFFRAFRERDLTWLLVLFATLVAAFFYLNAGVSLGLHLFTSALALSALTWLFGLHWYSLCTASPLDQRTADSLRSEWSGYLLVYALFPLAVYAIGWLGSYRLAFFTVIAVCLVQPAFALALHGGRVSPRTLCQAVVSWLAYNRREIDLPGTFHSPAGPWRARLITTGACVFLIAVTNARLPITFLIAYSDTVREYVAQVFATPESTGAMRLGGTADAIAGFIVLALGNTILPVAVTVFTPLILTLPLLIEAARYRSPSVRPEGWQGLVDELQRSFDPIERGSVYMGHVVSDGSPLLVPRKAFHEHAHFLGDTGSGKTSLGLAPLIEQLIAPGDCSVVVIDLKGDTMELLGTLRAGIEQAKRRSGRTIAVKHFTNQPKKSSFGFNPLLQPFWRELELYMRTDIQCGALGLTYGADYGEGFYSSANAAVLYHTIKTFPEASSYRELAKRIGYVVANAKRTELHPEIRKAGIHVQTVLDRLASFDALNVAPGERYPQDVVDGAINLADCFEQPQVLYFHLSATLGPGSAPEIARLVTYSLLAAATQANRKHQVFLVIDEFQRMISRNIEYMLQLARSMGVGVILANQTMQDLRTSKADLIPAIESNCRYRQWFAVSSEDDRNRLVRGSGETVDLAETRTYTSGPNGSSTSVSYQEQVVPRLRPNEILLASDHPRQSIVHISRGVGYAQYGGMPFIVEGEYHVSQQEFERRKSTPWPEAGNGAFVPGTLAANSPAEATARPAGPVITTEIIDNGELSPELQGSPFELLGDEPVSGNSPRPKRKGGRK